MVEQPVSNGGLTLTCAMTTNGYTAMIEDSGSAYYGHALCGNFLTAGWTEDTAAENQVADQSRADAQASASAASAAASADQVAGQQTTATGLVTSLHGDIVSLTKDLSTLDGDLQAERTDLAALKKDAANGPGNSCENIFTVTSDAANTVGSDATNTVGSDATNFIGNDIQTIHNDASSLADVATKITTSGTTPPVGWDGAISAANQAAAGGIAHANTTIDKANALAAEGFRIANQLAVGSCAGMGPGDYQPVAHIG